MTWQGDERRSNLCCTEVSRLETLERKLGDLDEMRADVKEVKKLLEQGKGMARLLQILFYVVGPVVAAIYWIKEHVR
jgi:hypothetical protein